MNKEPSFDGADTHFSDVLFALCKNVDTPHALATWLCYKYDHAALVDLQFDPRDYGDAALDAFCRKGAGPMWFAYDLGVTEFVSKYTGLKLGINTKEAAIQSFKTSEQRLMLVNKELRTYLTKPASPRLEAIITIARRKISEVLGVLSDSTVVGGWGPGSTFSIRGDVGWDKKILETKISVTAAALPYAARLIGADLHWCQARGIPAEGPCTLMDSEFSVVSGNRISTVAKNAKTDRTIAIEPTANIYLQKSAGRWIRGRLKKVARIDLDDQGANQRAAGTLKNATIDLKSASDSISISLVRLLLPDEWIDWLGALRSENYKLGPQWVRYEKWSSMGNGYTFELETLLFWAIASAVQLIDTDRSYAVVYGDDIVVPIDHAQTTINALNMLGFQINTKKTHFDSLYRESCGSHYFDGWLVTPVYQKEVPNHVAELYNMANRLRHFASRLGGYQYSCSRIHSSWLACVKAARSETRQIFYSPYNVREGDEGYGGTLHVSLEDCEQLGLPVRLYGYRSKYYRFVPKRRPYDQAAGLALSFSSSHSDNSDKEWSFRDADKVPSSTDGLLGIRGQGRVCTRETRVYRSFRSNCWL